MRGRRANNLMAGSFLLGSLALTIIVSVVLSDISISSKTPYTVRFTLSDGAEGVKRGSEVTMGGQSVGRVVDIDFATESDTIAGVDVGILIRKDIVLREGAMVDLVRPLLGTMSSLNIRDPGRRDAAPLEEGALLLGTLADPAFLQGGKTGQTLESVQKAAAKIELLLDALPLDTAERIAKIVEDVERTTGRFDSATERWTGTIDSSIEAAGRFASKLPEIPDRVGEVLDQTSGVISRLDRAGEQAELGVGEAREMLGAVGRIVDRNAPKIDAFVENLTGASDRINARTIPAINEFIDGLDEPRRDMASAVRRIDTFLREELAEAQTVLTNTRLATGQLRLAATEIRAAPWRLLARPTTRELDTQLLYDSARTYAEAVSNLRAAGEALDSALSEHGVAGDPRTIEDLHRLRDRLHKALESHAEAEGALFERMLNTKAR